MSPNAASRVPSARRLLESMPLASALLPKRCSSSSSVAGSGSGKPLLPPSIFKARSTETSATPSLRAGWISALRRSAPGASRYHGTDAHYRQSPRLDLSEPEFSEEIHRIIKDSQLRIFEKSSHSQFDDEPERLLSRATPAKNCQRRAEGVPGGTGLRNTGRSANAPADAG